MTKRIFTLAMAICLISGLKAQFSSSQEVYCYQYVKSFNDGITSKENCTTVYFFNFQKDMMGIGGGYDAKDISKALLENPNRFNEEAINDLGDRYREWKNAAPEGGMAAYSKSISIYKYDSKYSTNSKYSYREYRKTSIWMGGEAWSEPKWMNNVYSFSIDKSELIKWSTDNPGKRKYYKRIDPYTLKPKIDFLN